MNMARSVVLAAVTVIIVSASSAYAAPCESVASASASTAYQKVDALLSEKIVATQLQAVGLSSEQAQARLSQLSERQLGELAAQADMIRIGGTIQSGNVNPLGPLGYVFHQASVFFCNVYRFMFSWAELK